MILRRTLQIVLLVLLAACERGEVVSGSVKIVCGGERPCNLHNIAPVALEFAAVTIDNERVLQLFGNSVEHPVRSLLLDLVYSFAFFASDVLGVLVGLIGILLLCFPSGFRRLGITLLLGGLTGGFLGALLGSLPLTSYRGMLLPCVFAGAGWGGVLAGVGRGRAEITTQDEALLGRILFGLAAGITAGFLPPILLAFFSPYALPFSCAVLLIAIFTGSVAIIAYQDFLRKHATESIWIEALTWIGGAAVGLMILRCYWK